MTGDGRAWRREKRELERALDRWIWWSSSSRPWRRSGTHAGSRRKRSGRDRRPGELLLRLRAIGPQTAAVLTLEAFYRHFDNRRQVAAFAGLSPSPWQSGAVVHDQGISKAGQPQLRKAMVELAWLWRRHQPGSALSRWYAERARGQDARRRRALIVALAASCWSRCGATSAPASFPRAPPSRPPEPPSQRIGEARSASPIRVGGAAWPAGCNTPLTRLDPPYPSPIVATMRIMELPSRQPDVRFCGIAAAASARTTRGPGSTLRIKLARTKPGHDAQLGTGRIPGATP